MYPVTLLWCCVHPKCRLVVLWPWPEAFSTALRSPRNELDRRAKWDQSLTDRAINNHRICWVDRSQFCFNGFFVIMLWYLAVIQTLNKCHSAGKIPGVCFFMVEILEGRALVLRLLSELRGGSQQLGEGMWSARFPCCQSTLIPELGEIGFLSTRCTSTKCKKLFLML